MILSFSWLIETGTSRTLCFFTTKGILQSVLQISAPLCRPDFCFNRSYINTKEPVKSFHGRFIGSDLLFVLQVYIKRVVSDSTWERGRDSLWLCTLFSSEDQEWSWRLKNKEIFSFNKCRSWDISELVLNSSKFWSSVVKRPGTSVPSRY